MVFKRLSQYLTIVALMVFTGPAAAMEPMAAIISPIDDVIFILNQPEVPKRTQRKEIWKVVNPIFDFPLISRLALKHHWKRFTETEKEDFTKVIAQFLGNTYIDRIQGEFRNEQVVYVGEEYLLDVCAACAEVQTLLVREAVEIPINYRMRRNTSGQWKVYDIIVEGVSLLINYRLQYDNYLKQNTPAQLIQWLNQKLEEQNQQLGDNG